MEAKLPIGIHGGAAALRDFTLQRPKGVLRVQLQDAPDHNPGIDLVAFHHVISSLGPVSNPPKTMLRRMTLPDRDYMHACCCAMRNKGCIPVVAECQVCGTENKAEVPATRVPLIDIEAPVVFVGDRACVETEVDLPTQGQLAKLVVAIPTIGSEYELAESSLRKTPDGKNAVSDSEIGIQRMLIGLVSLNGQTPTREMLEALDLDDFDAVMRTMNAVKYPHLDDEVVMACSNCHAQVKTRFAFNRWLLPLSAPTEVKS